MVAACGIGGSEARIDAAEPTEDLQTATKAGNRVPDAAIRVSPSDPSRTTNRGSGATAAAPGRGAWYRSAPAMPLTGAKITGARRRRDGARRIPRAVRRAAGQDCGKGESPWMTVAF